MNRNDQRKITKNLVTIKKALHKDIDSVIDRLVAVKVFPAEVKTEVRNLRTSVPQLRCGWMLNKLLRSGPDAFKKFVHVLEDLGKYSLIQTLEKTAVPEATVLSLQPDREKTFVIPSPRIPERLSSRLSDVNEGCETPKPLDEVQQLERMMTIVLSTLDEKDSNNNRTVDNHKDIHQQLVSESRGNDQLMGFFKSLRNNRCSMTAHSLTVN